MIKRRDIRSRQSAPTAICALLALAAMLLSALPARAACPPDSISVCLTPKLGSPPQCSCQKCTGGKIANPAQTQCVVNFSKLKLLANVSCLMLKIAHDESVAAGKGGMNDKGELILTCCPKGWVHVDNGGGIYECHMCPANTYKVGEYWPAGCKACPQGQISDAGRAECCASKIYHTSASAYGHCRTPPSEICPPGSQPFYSAVVGHPTCETCPAGTYDRLTPEGFRLCHPCLPGTISASAGQTSCTPCPPGQTSDPTRTTCIAATQIKPARPKPVACRGATVANAERTACVACAPGSKPNADRTACVAAATGSPGDGGGTRTPAGAPGILETPSGLGPLGPAGAGSPSGGGSGGARPGAAVPR